MHCVDPIGYTGMALSVFFFARHRRMQKAAKKKKIPRPRQICKQCALRKKYFPPCVYFDQI